jgi:hypothetical protein
MNENQLTPIEAHKKTQNTYETTQSGCFVGDKFLMLFSASIPPRLNAIAVY